MRTGIFEDEQFYICHDGRELRHLRTESKEQDGYTQTFEVYGCADCSGCEHKARCLYKYDAEKDAEKNKVMKINEQWEELKEKIASLAVTDDLKLRLVGDLLEPSDFAVLVVPIDKAAPKGADPSAAADHP